MTGEQRYQIPVLLDQDSVYIVGIDDLYIHNFVSQGLPKVRYVNLIPVLEQFYIQKVLVPVPAPVPGDHAVADLAADRDAGLREDAGAVDHVFVAGTEVQGHFRIHPGDADHTEDLIGETVCRQIKVGILVGLPTVETGLLRSIEPFVIVPHLNIGER